MCNLQNMQRVIEERLPLLASCADELAIMQCAALSCVAALLAAQAGLSTSANGATRKGTQEAGELSSTCLEFSNGSLLRGYVCRRSNESCPARVFPVGALTLMLGRHAHQRQRTSCKWVPFLARLPVEGPQHVMGLRLTA